MSFDMYLEITGAKGAVKGESKDALHANWIEVLAYTFGVSQNVTGVGSHAGGRADLDPVTITKKLDASSPTLAVFCCDATPLPTVKLELCRASGDKVPFMKYTLSDCVISKVETEGDGASEDIIPTEKISFVYGKIEWEYTSTDLKGALGAKPKAGWDAAANKKV